MNYITIIAPIKPNREKYLRHHLQEEVAPQDDPNTILKCRPSFPFDNIKSLHFCSMLILEDVDEPNSACLVFEATFDGSKEEFLDEILRSVPEGIENIYQNCEGYPECGIKVPGLIKEYFIRHDVGANAFYTGSPGRSVAEIRDEQQVRDKIASWVSDRRSQHTPPTTLLQFQRELQQNLIRTACPWAEERARVPWEITRRSAVATAACLALIIAACGIGWLASRLASRLFGLELMPIQDIINLLLTLPSPLQLPLATALPRSLPLVLCVIFWYLIRVLEFSVFEYEDPRKYSFLKGAASHLLFIARFVFIVAIFAVAVHLAAQPSPPSPLWLIFWLIIDVVILMLLHYLITSLNLRIKLKELLWKEERWRRLGLSIARFLFLAGFAWALMIVGILSLMIIRFFFLKPDLTLPLLSDYLTLALSPALIIADYILYGVIVLYIVWLIAFGFIRLLEVLDRKRFWPASKLVPSVHTLSSVYEREERGVHKYQNHLASLTHVKRGRTLILRLTLSLIGLLARYWYNRGELGGIPTILAARWAIIKGKNGEKYLLFLTNYSGSFDSYLNEFIDMGAVKGVNAIWSNTFVRSARPSVPWQLGDATSKWNYAFPETKCYLSKGAQAEKPFKAYVRHSQIDTIVWYSAYPKLTIVNINTNTELRQALFKPLAPCELDSVFLRAGL